MISYKWKKLTILGTLSVFFLSNLFSNNQNLVKNPGFEMNKNGLPKFWEIKDSPLEYFQIVTHEKAEGKQSLLINNKRPHDTMLIQNIKVKKNSFYHIKAVVKTDEIVTDRGAANITLYYISNGNGSKGIYTSPELQDTRGKWLSIEFIIKTRKDINDPLTIGLRLGGQGLVNKGKVYFDEIIVSEINSPQKGLSFFDFNHAIQKQDNNHSTAKKNNKTRIKRERKKDTKLLIHNEYFMFSFSIAILLLTISISIILQIRKNKKK
jgi:hypothetical protein